jgi:hypothetical protein
MDLYDLLHGHQLSLMIADRSLTTGATQGAPMAPLDPVT